MRNTILALILAMSLDVLGMKAHAEFYHYTDSNGSVHCVDNISSVPEQYRSQLKNVQSHSEVSTNEPQAVDRPRKKTAQYSGTVDIFVTSSCGYCKDLEQFFESNGICYTAFDIEKDDNARKKYKELGGRGVPLTRIGSSVVSGYNPDAILKAIEREQKKMKINRSAASDSILTHQEAP